MDLGLHLNASEEFDEDTKPAYVAPASSITSSNVMTEAEGIAFPTDTTNKFMNISPKYGFGFEPNSTLAFWIFPSL